MWPGPRWAYERSVIASLTAHVPLLTRSRHSRLASGFTLLQISSSAKWAACDQADIVRDDE